MNMKLSFHLWTVLKLNQSASCIMMLRISVPLAGEACTVGRNEENKPAADRHCGSHLWRTYHFNCSCNWLRWRHYCHVLIHCRGHLSKLQIRACFSSGGMFPSIPVPSPFISYVHYLSISSLDFVFFIGLQSPIQPLKLIVPANYPRTSPNLLDKMPVARWERWHWYFDFIYANYSWKSDGHHVVTVHALVIIW